MSNTQLEFFEDSSSAGALWLIKDDKLVISRGSSNIVSDFEGEYAFLNQNEFYSIYMALNNTERIKIKHDGTCALFECFLDEEQWHPIGSVALYNREARKDL